MLERMEPWKHEARTGEGRGGPLHRGTADALDGPAWSGSRACLPDHDDGRQVRGVSPGPGRARVPRERLKPAVGSGPDLRGDLGRLRLRCVRHRRLFAFHRRLAGVEFVKKRSGARRPRRGSSRAPASSRTESPSSTRQLRTARMRGRGGAGTARLEALERPGNRRSWWSRLG